MVLDQRVSVEFPDGPDHGTVVRSLVEGDDQYFVVQFDRQGRALVSPTIADKHDEFPEGTPVVIVCHPGDVGLSDEQPHEWHGAMLKVLD